MKQQDSSPRAWDVVVRRRVFKDKATGWRPVKSSAPPPKEWGTTPLRESFVSTVPAAIERALDEQLRGSGSSLQTRAGDKGGIFVGRGLHEWRGARLVLGEWRADVAAPYQGSVERHGVSTSGEERPAQTCALDVRGEAHARTWGMWFVEPECAGRMERLNCAFSTLEGGEVLLEVWGRPWSFFWIAQKPPKKQC